MRSCRGLAGDRGLSLAFDLLERKSGLREDVLRSGVGDFTFRNRREWVNELVIEEKFLNLRAVDGESSTKPSLSPSTLPDGIPIGINLQSCSCWEGWVFTPAEAPNPVLVNSLRAALPPNGV